MQAICENYSCMTHPQNISSVTVFFTGEAHMYPASLNFCSSSWKSLATKCQCFKATLCIFWKHLSLANEVHKLKKEKKDHSVPSWVLYPGLEKKDHNDSTSLSEAWYYYSKFPFNITNSKRSSSSSTESVMQFNKIRQNNISGSVENRDYSESYLNQKAVRSCTLRYSCWNASCNICQTLKWGSV